MIVSFLMGAAYALAGNYCYRSAAWHPAAPGYESFGLVADLVIGTFWPAALALGVVLVLVDRFFRKGSRNVR